MTPSVRQHPSLPPPSHPDLSAPIPVPGPSKLMEPASPCWGTLSAHPMVGRGLPYPEGSQDRRGGALPRGEPQERKERRREGWWGAPGPLRCSSAGPAPASQLHFSPRGAGVPGWGLAGGKGGAPLSTHSCLHPLFCPRAPAGPPAPCQGEPRPSRLTRQELLELVTSRLSPRGTLSFLVNKFLQRPCSVLTQGTPRGGPQAAHRALGGPPRQSLVCSRPTS